MPPKGVDQQAREAMTHKIAQRLTAMQAGQNMIDAARQIEAKCFDSAKDAQDYERKVEKRLARAAKAHEASQEAKRPRSSDSARDLLREHGATLEWWRSSDVIGRRLRAIIDAATQAGSVGDEARTWASAALQKVEKLEKAATSLLKQLEARSGNLSELPGYCTKLKESKAALEAHLGKLWPQWAPSSIGEAAVEMRFRKIISGTCRVDAGEWLDTDEDSVWYAGLREAVRRCRDDDDTRHVAYEDFDAAGRALVDKGVERILTAMEDSCFVPKWARLELHKAFVISYDAAHECSSHAEHVDPGSDVTINCPLTPDEEYDGGELTLRVFPSALQLREDVTWEDGIDYITRFKAEFAGEPEIYHEFLEIMKSMKTGQIDTREVIRSVSALLAGHPQLLYGFNMFLPDGGYAIEVPTLNVTPRRGALVIHSGGVQHGARELTRGARSALIIWTKRSARFDNFRRIPDDVQRKHMLPFLNWRGQVAFATATTRCRKLVAPLWAARRVHMERRVLDIVVDKLWGITQETIDTMRSIIQSAPPGRDAIAGTIATLVAVSAPLFSSEAPEFPARVPPFFFHRRRVAMQHEFVFAALDSLLRDVVVTRYRDLPWNLWFDKDLVKSE